jgi:hypothetical protein
MMKNGFDRINTYVDDNHWSRYLLKCHECGQLYFYEFYEWTDWTDGNDPRYSTYIPVETDADVEELRKTLPVELLQFVPRLQRDFPKEATEPRASWVGK